MAVFYRHQITNVRVGVSKQVKENGYDTFYFYIGQVGKINIFILMCSILDIKIKVEKKYLLKFKLIKFYKVRLQRRLTSPVF